MDSAQGDELSLTALVQRVIFVNFAAIRTSTDVGLIRFIISRTSVHVINFIQTFVHLLFDLAANPSYLQPLRQEVEAIVNEEGWTKASIGKMHKIDSFLRESQRVHGIGTRAYSSKNYQPFSISSQSHRRIARPQGR